MSLPPEMLQQRYSAIERAYSERRWPEVESLSQGLLAELEPNPADPLQLRLVLLLGHTRLYGLADPSGARHCYDSVLEHGEEPTLRDIAQQGLAQCGQAADQQPASSKAAAPWLTDSDPSAPGSRTTAVTTLDASPWLGGRTDAEQGSRPPEPEPEAQSEREPEPEVPSPTPPSPHALPPWTATPSSPRSRPTEPPWRHCLNWRARSWTNRNRSPWPRPIPCYARRSNWRSSPVPWESSPQQMGIPGS